jgi:hypothetical protein
MNSPANVHIVRLLDAVFTVTMVATVELGNVQTLQKLVSTATIAVSVVASQLVAQIAGGDRSFWYDSSWSIPVYRPTCFRIRPNPSSLISCLRHSSVGILFSRPCARASASAAPVVLDASGSFDPDVAPGALSLFPLAYSWTCAPVTAAPNQNQACPPAVVSALNDAKPKSPTMSLDAAAFLDGSVDSVCAPVLRSL